MVNLQVQESPSCYDLHTREILTNLERESYSYEWGHVCYLKPAKVCCNSFALLFWFLFAFLFSPPKEKANTCTAVYGNENALSPEGTNTTKINFVLTL